MRRTFSQLVLLVVCKTALFAQSLPADSTVFSSLIEIRNSLIRTLWNLTVAPQLDSALWQPEKAYNAGHFFMIPLHAAFQWNDSIWQKQFSHHFQRFAQQESIDRKPDRLSRLHYLYWVSWYMLLCTQKNYDSLLAWQLYHIIEEEITLLWHNESAWIWANPFVSSRELENMRSRILWKLYNPELPPVTFWRAIVDEEKFTFAIAANMKAFLKLLEADTVPRSLLWDDILQINFDVWQRRVVWNEKGGWLFQPGFWSDHKDFAYAANTDKASPKYAPMADVAEDVSHSHRMALWLNSFLLAYEAEKRLFYNSLLHGLEQQFFNEVLVYPNDSINTFLTKNYMNGWNGLYRWNYFPDKPGTGYGPYELSGTLLLGWWTFLNTERIKEVYRRLAVRFPLSEDVLAIYEMRTGHPRPPDRKENQYTNGLCHLICLLASMIK